MLMSILQVLQNKVAKIILDRPLYSSSTHALDTLKWVPLENWHFQRRPMISSTIRVHNQSDTNFFSNISFILSGTIVRLHTNKGNMFVNKYATFREYSLHSYFLRDFCFKKLIKNMAVTRNIYTDGMLFDNKYLDQSAPY